MGKFGKYVKRGIKYVLKEHKQPIVKPEIVIKKPSEDFNDRTYIITGGGSGIGYYIAKKLISENAKVIITGRDEKKLKDAVKNLGKKSKYYVLDLINIDEFDTFMENVFKDYKKIDGIINNAGISLHEWDFMKVDKKKFEDQFLINLRGGYFLTQSYIRQYEKHNQLEGKILFISSERGTYADDLPYGLTKASINSFVKALSFKYYKLGINVNAISPGVTTTNMTGKDKNDDLYLNQNSQRYFIPEEIAEVAMFLLSNYSNCISGEIIHTNGGNHIRRGY